MQMILAVVGRELVRPAVERESRVGNPVRVPAGDGAEETRPREAIELYRQYAERLIALRDRKNYQAACKYLAKMRALYEKLGESEAWTSYITALREQNRNLRALKEELANAGL